MMSDRYERYENWFLFTCLTREVTELSKHIKYLYETQTIPKFQIIKVLKTFTFNIQND
jgi:hypothetical protein